MTRLNIDMKRNVLASFFILMFILTMVMPSLERNSSLLSPISPAQTFEQSADITAEAKYNASSFGLAYGTNTTTVIETGAMNNIDNTNASFLEETVDGPDFTLLGDAWTDSISYWDTYYRFDNPQIVAGGVVGANCYRAQFSSKEGIPILRFDNNTAQAADIDTSDVDHFNVSIRASVTKIHFLSITFYNTITKYYSITPDIELLTTWQTFDYTRNDFTSFGGMTAASKVNWIDFRFSVPKDNEWIYIDAPKFYGTTEQRRLGAVFNFTNIAPFENYKLNITAATNVTVEKMRISDNFDAAAVYDLVGTNVWESYSIYLNATTAHTQGFFTFFINSTLLSDTYTSTLDIDVFQIYAWNSTIHRPTIRDCRITNIDTGNKLYAGYKNYTLTFNMTDTDGFSNIDVATVSFRSVVGTILWRLGWNQTSGTFLDVKEAGNVTLQTSICSNVSSGDNIDLTFAFEIELPHGSFTDAILVCFVNDTYGESSVFEQAQDLGFDVEVNTDLLDATLSSSSGYPAELIFCSGQGYYYNSTVPISRGTYDIWVYNTINLANKSDEYWTVGNFNVTNIQTSDTPQTYTYYIVTVESGDTYLGTNYGIVTFSLEYTVNPLEQLYNVTSHNVILGENQTDAVNMDILDNVNATYYEQEESSEPITVLGEQYTDSLSLWGSYGGFDPLTVATPGYIGSYCLEAFVKTKTGPAHLYFDNGTSQAMGLDMSEIESFNFSIRATSIGQYLGSVEFHNAVGIYYQLSTNYLLTSTWTVLDYDRSSFTSVGGIQPDDPINWIDFIFTSPDDKTYVYIDSMLGYNDNPSYSLSVTLNFTGIGQWEYYYLNISSLKSEPDTSERFAYYSPYFWALTEVYLGNTTDSFSTHYVRLNQTIIQEDGFAYVTLNDTKRTDDILQCYVYIDLLQIYGYNSTNTIPTIQSCIVTNIEIDNSMYAGYRNYTIVLNVTDADGFDDIYYARFGLETTSIDLLWAVGWFEDTSTFVKEVYPDPTMVTLQSAQCSNISSGTTVSITFVVMINVLHGSWIDINLFAYVTDGFGSYDERHYAVGYDVEVGVTLVNYSLSKDRGNPSETLYCTGYAYYEGSTFTLNPDMYDLWVTNDEGLLYSTRTEFIESGFFNITDIPTPVAVGEYTYEIGAKAEGDDGYGPWYYDVFEDTYIADALSITLTPTDYEPSNGDTVNVVISVTRQFDSSIPSNFSGTLSWNGGVLNFSQDSTSVTVSLESTTEIMSVLSVTESTYNLTAFTPTSISIHWSAASGGGGGGVVTTTTPVITTPVIPPAFISFNTIVMLLSTGGTILLIIIVAYICYRVIVRYKSKFEQKWDDLFNY